MIRRSFAASHSSSLLNASGSSSALAASFASALHSAHSALFSSKRLQSSSGASSSADYYSLLGVAPSASQDEIKKQYRERAKACHPDRPGGSEEKFKKLSEAYSVLSNPEKKQQYDAMRSFGGGGGGGGGDGGGFPHGGFPGGFPPGGGGGGPGGSYAQYTSRSAAWSPPPGGVTDPYRHRSQSGPFDFSGPWGGGMSRQDADRMFQSIFGNQSLDEIFRSAEQSGTPHTTTTKRNADGTFTTDETYRTKDGRTVRISRTYDRETGPGGANSGGGGGGASSSYDSFAQQARQQQQQQHQQQAANNPFHAGAFGAGPFGGNPFFRMRNQMGSGASSAFRGGSPASGGGFPNPFTQPGSPFAEAFRGTAGGFTAPGQQQQQQQQHQYQGHQQQTFNSPFQSGYWTRPGGFGSPFGGFFYRYPLVRLLAINLAIIFVLSAIFSFSFTHPLFFFSMLFLFWISRARL